MAVSKKKSEFQYGGVKPVQKAIRLKKQSPTAAKEIKEEHNLSDVAARVLAARGYKPGPKLKTFINPTLKEGLVDPWELKGLREACELTAEILKDNKKIAVCCDFDVDGLSGGAQAVHFLKSIGAECSVFVPDRFAEGYGLNAGMIERISKEGFSLLIAIDYGTTNIKELTLARDLGLKTIVIDHHHVASLPPTDVFINPNQPGCGFADKVLSASGLAWYFLVGLRQTLDNKKIEVRNYLDLACLGTICDMVPLTGVNRVIAKRGLEFLSRSERAGLIALKEVIGLYGEVSCSNVGFGIGPRLNAAGRMVHGEVVIDLLTTTSGSQASSVARQLNKLNQERQETELAVKEKAIRQIESWGSLPSGVVVWDAEFHTGVVGIVAQRLVELFYRPAVVLGLDTDGVFKGSVRGIKGFSVVDALHSLKELLIKFGGHEGAGGLSLEEKNLEKFKEAWDEECKKRLKSLETEPYAEADTEVSLDDISIDLVDELSKFAPFGMGNPSPVLLAKGLKVTETRVLKETHLKATLTDGKRFIAGMLWQHKEHPAIFPGAKINVAFKADYNTFNGTTELQAVIAAAEKA